MPKNIENDPPRTQNGGQISKKWKRCDVRKKRLSGHEKFCDVLKPKNSTKKKTNKKKNIARLNYNGPARPLKSERIFCNVKFVVSLVKFNYIFRYLAYNY